MAEKKAIVLVSGGLDSATVIHHVAHLGYSIYALSFSYGQRHEIEIEGAKRIVNSIGESVIEHKVMHIDLRAFGGSALTDDSIPVPIFSSNLQFHSLKEDDAKSSLLSYKEQWGDCNNHEERYGCSDYNQSEINHHSAAYNGDNNAVKKAVKETRGGYSLGRVEDIPLTYVPARNTIFLSYALAYAEVRNASDIFVGVNAVDYSGYPDCRPEYIAAFQKMANLATAVGVKSGAHQGTKADEVLMTDEVAIKIQAPLIALSKKEIISMGLRLGVDYGLTTSCYNPVVVEKYYQEQKTHYAACGKCDACVLRLQGFALNGIIDPVEYIDVD